MKNFLVIRTDRIGEVILTSAVVDVIKKHSPDSKIAFVTSSLSKSILEIKTGIDEVLIFETMDRIISFSEAFQFAKKLRQRKIDVAIIVNPHKMLHFVCFLAGIKVRVGLDRKWPFFLTHRIVDLRGEGAKSEVEYVLDMLKPIGIVSEYLIPHFWFEDKMISQGRVLLEGAGVNLQKKVILIHAGSNFVYKR